ncbi:MAG: DUF2156 domain-containing protein [Armatimonadetes bacterium]|nr:DUF2156 domain-containing protein [Armatimonadota bacterium]
MKELPTFPDMEALEIEHKPIIDALLHELQPETSELTFTNLYIWRHPYGLQVTELEGAVCLLALRPDPEDSFLLPPLGEAAGTAQVRACLEWMADHEHNPRLWRIGEAAIARLGLSADEFSIESDRDNWDYVYRVRDLVDLPEVRYQDKVRHITQFTRKFKPEYHRITPDLVQACQDLQDLWCDEKHCDLYSSLHAEARAVKEALSNLDALGITGGCLMVRGRVQAFALGEPLNDTTVVIHIEKASPDLHGAFQAINQQFLEHEWQDFEYVNREQDVGEPGLRKAKESYHPVKMVEKYVVTAR